MNELLEKIVDDMNLIPIDEIYRNVRKVIYGHEIDDKYKYRTLDGEHIYSIDYLLSMHKEGEAE